MRIIILLGPPGSGKGTLAQMCENNKFAVIGAGNLLRERASEKDLFALELRRILDSGNMVDNDIILKIVLDKFNVLKSNQDLVGILLDGYPRSLCQMESFYYYLYNNYPHLIDELLVFSITADEKLLYNRISKRFICVNSSCGRVNSDVKKCIFCDSDVVRRTDDLSKNAIETRLTVFKKSISQLISFFTKKNISMCNLDVSEFTTKEEMFESFCKFVIGGKSL